MVICFWILVDVMAILFLSQMRARLVMRLVQALMAMPLATWGLIILLQMAHKLHCYWGAAQLMQEHGPVAGTARHILKRTREEQDMDQGRYDKAVRNSDADCSDGGMLATSIEEYYGPMWYALADMRRSLGRDPPDGIQGLALLTECFDEAKSRLTAAQVLRPTFGPIAAGDVGDLLNSQLTDRSNANEYAAGPGPFEWCALLKCTVSEWNAFDAEEREEALQDAAFSLEEYACCLVRIRH
jgi:hypothetical protein